MKIKEFTFWYLDEQGIQRYKFYKGTNKAECFSEFQKWCKKLKYIAI